MHLRRKLLKSLRHLVGPTYPHSERLIDCTSCGAEVMNPVRSHVLDESTWWIRLRCGACGFVREVEASNAQARRLDTDLDRGLNEIAAAVAKLDRAEMAAVSAALTAGLERDLLGPDDFRRR
jgi:uncharacterized Zn finger protein